jgi:foldase protein PrsA
MKNGKIAIAFVLCLLMLVMGTACGDSGGDDGKVLAKVGSVKISQSQVDEMASFLALANGMDLSTFDETMQTDIKNSMLIFYVDNELMKLKMKDKKIITKDVESEIETNMKQFLDQSSGTEGETVRQQLTAAKVSEETLRYYFSTQYYSEEMQKEVDESDPVTDDEIQKYYDENKTTFTTPGSFTGAHILMGDAEHKAEDKTAIEKVRKEAVDGGDFAALAEKYSTDTGTATQGGIYNFTQGDGTDAAFEEAALALKKGEVSKVVESSFGFHIIKATEDPIAQRQLSLDEVKESIKSNITTEHFEAAVKAMEKEYEKQITWYVDLDPETGLPPTDASQQASESASDPADSATGEEDVDGEEGAENTTSAATEG